LSPQAVAVAEGPAATATPPPSQSTAISRILRSAPADPVFETARTSSEAIRGLGTKRALYHRLAHTRQLARAWEQAGKFLAQARRRLRVSEESELDKQFADIRELLVDFPAFVGQPGQPGQHVAALVRQQAALPTFKMLDIHQREALAKDWIAGKTLLAFHRQFIRQELQAHRRRTCWGRTVRAVRAALNDHPGYVILAVGVVALVIALFHWWTGS
jgi:hypothetical protein